MRSSICSHVRTMDIPVYWFVTPVAPGRQPYLAELAAFGRWGQRYPEIPVMYTHGLPLFRFMKNGNVAIPPEAWRPLEAPNVIVEILIPIFQGAIWEYPYVEAQPVIREYYERLGPDKLAWGSDMPNVERHCTYKQSLDYLRRGYVNRCVNDIRRRPSQPLSQRRSHLRIERRDRRLRSTQGPSDA